MKQIGIYRKAFPRVSEAFITEQVRNLTRHSPTFITCTVLGKIPFKYISISQNDFLKIKQLVYYLTRYPSLFSSHLNGFNNLSLIHAHFGTDGVYAMALADKLKIPLVVTFHGYETTLSRQAMWQSCSPLYYQFLFHEEELKLKASAFIAISNFLHDNLVKKGYPKEKIIQHYIGVDTEKFSPINRQPNERYILCVGRHVEKKGIDVLLRAFARIANKHKQVSLFQVGAGEMTATLETLAKQLGICDRVRFLGAQPHEIVRNLMQNAEIFALPSQTAKDGNSETLGLVFNEASACGIPIVSTWHGGIPEAVLDGETGFLVPEKNERVLAERLDMLLSDPALGKQMGLRGREFVCEVFDIRKQTAKLESIYESLMN